MLRITNVFAHDLHILTGAYALDALEDAAEQDRFARHLRRCSACEAEVRGLREVSTALAFAASAEPPRELRERVLTAAAHVRQLPPEVSSHARSRRHMPAWWTRIPWMIWLPRLSTVTAVIAVAVAVVLGLAQSNTEHRLNQARAQFNQVQAQDQAIAAVLAAPDVRSVAGSTSAGGTTTVMLSAALRKLVVSTSGLPALADGKVYQLWLIGPDLTKATVIRSAGLLPLAALGRTSPVLAAGLVAGDKLAMTVEPAGGTKQPTTTPILDLTLPV
jgi:Anti-sigma-K factor rskA